MMMDDQMYNVPSDGRNSLVMDGIVRHTSMNSLVQSYSFDLNHQNHIRALLPVLSSLEGEPAIDCHSDLRVRNNAGVVESNPFVSSQRSPNVRDSTFVSSGFSGNNSVFQDTPNCSASLATLLASRGGGILQENLNSLAISAVPINSSEAYALNHCSNNSDSVFGTSVNCAYDDALGSINGQWEMNKYSAPSELGQKTPVIAGFQPFSTGNLDPNGWFSSNVASSVTYQSYGSSQFSKELALTLATSSPSTACGVDVRNQCLDAGSSRTAPHCLNQTRFGLSEQNSCNSDQELSLSYESRRPPELSQVICGSRYLHVVQEILSDIANYSLENLDQSSFSSSRVVSMMDSDFDNAFEAHEEPALRKQEIKAKKDKLLALLQMLDDCYNQCVDEIHTVVSAFHAATETDPHIHARFALQTISLLYKSLRERICGYFLAMSANASPASPAESERSFEIQKQLALEHLKKKDHQIWKPQRGLPERSVSVLRAWMFQNFLHPYPKDAEKHVLAVKSGLTRSQVSNWFINARVRVWKPMIEEMYAEMNRRKARQNDNPDSNRRSHHHISINSHKFGVN